MMLQSSLGWSLKVGSSGCKCICLLQNFQCTCLKMNECINMVIQIVCLITCSYWSSPCCDITRKRELCVLMFGDCKAVANIKQEAMTHIHVLLLALLSSFCDIYDSGESVHECWYISEQCTLCGKQCFDLISSGALKRSFVVVPWAVWNVTHNGPFEHQSQLKGWTCATGILGGIDNRKHLQCCARWHEGGVFEYCVGRFQRL